MRSFLRHMKHSLNTNRVKHECNKRSKLLQTDSVVRAAVLSITAAGVGITLTAASVVIFAEIYFIPGALLQVAFFYLNEKTKLRRRPPHDKREAQVSYLIHIRSDGPRIDIRVGEK